MDPTAALEEVKSKIAEKQREIDQQNRLIEEIEKKKCNLRARIVRLNHDLNRVPIGIHSLPDEVLSYICENFLDLHSQRSCQQVCRRWYHVIDFRSTRLVFYGERQELNALKGQRWFSDNTPINTNWSIMLRRTKIYSTFFTSFDTPPLTQPFLLNLKRLYICKSIDRKLWNIVDFVNKLTNLEELELGALWEGCERPYTFWIHCPNLKSLAIGTVFTNVTICITSKPIKFKTEDYMSQFEFEHPGEVQEVHLMSEFCGNDANLQFANLKVLKCAHHISEIPCRRLIENSPGLTDLHLGQSNDRTHYELVKKSALNALELKKQFKRQQLSVFFYGVKLDSAENFSSFH